MENPCEAGKLKTLKEMPIWQEALMSDLKGR